ncbi:MAG: cyclase family protein [Theionarchaea archaeon]|nr:cyclase family protein [Theionarchaea archaeon]
MSNFVDLSHYFEDNMPGFKLKNEDGTFTQFTARIRPFLTHDETREKFKRRASFEITEIEFQTSVGTYIDSPYHRFPDGRDISEIKIEEVILPGVVIDARGRCAGAVSSNIIPEGVSLEGCAVLFNFGWDTYWGTDMYERYPFISKESIHFLIEAGARLVGVDTINVDDSQDLTRPAHTLFLKNDIYIVENLMNLHSLHKRKFRFFAVPIKGKKVAAMPVRAFAEILK